MHSAANICDCTECEILRDETHAKLLLTYTTLFDLPNFPTTATGLNEAGSELHSSWLYIKIKNFAWEDQSRKQCYIADIEPETREQCYIG